jgi:hypothetical protein
MEFDEAVESEHVGGCKRSFLAGIAPSIKGRQPNDFSECS